MEPGTHGIIETRKSGRFIKIRSTSIFESHRVTYYQHDTDYDIPAISKTIARLDRGPLFPIINTISGWTGEGVPDRVLSNFV